MKIYEVKSYEQMSRKAANILSAQVILNPTSVLGLATGSTPVGIYEQLIVWYNNGDIDFSAVRTVNLDEYKGLAPDNDQSYRYFMQKHLFNHINILPQNTHVPNGLAASDQEECARYDEVIAGCGGIDIQLLGLGNNGHIGFNEPGDAFAAGTHCVSLTQSTIDANKRFFHREEDVPRQAYTMGTGSIMQAKKILLVVCGEQKAKAVREALTGPVTPQMPASILQLHGDVTLVGDEAALSLL